MKRLMILAAAGLAALPMNAADKAPATVVADTATTTLAKIEPGLVRVEYHLKRDRGENPRFGTAGERCPGCGQFHGVDSEEFLRDERPYEIGGYLIDDTSVVLPSPQLPARFVSRIVVKHGDASAEASFDGLAKDAPAEFLKLRTKLDGASPLRFAASTTPATIVTNAMADGRRVNAFAAIGAGVTLAGNEAPFITLPCTGVMLDASGNPCGLALDKSMPADPKRRLAANPAEWPRLSANDIAAARSRFDAIADKALLRATLRFREKGARSENTGRFSYSREDRENDGEREVPAVLLADGRVLVLVALKPDATARLESVVIHTAEGEQEAKFERSLRRLGAFTATLDKALPGAIAPAKGDIRTHADRWLFAVDFSVKGEQRVIDFAPQRFAAFKPGQGGIVYPEIPGGERPAFIFDADGKLAALPVIRRAKPSAKQSYSNEERMLITPASLVAEAIEHPETHTDAANVPTTAAEQNRLAWFGVDLQQMNQELARANRVSDRTDNGESGALVTFVHPDSPAAGAGIKPGAVLLRLRPADSDDAIDIRHEDDDSHSRFPWARIDEVPEQYFERMPTPWPSVDCAFTKVLGEIGAGNKVTLEYVQDGKTATCDFTIAKGPAHYDAAPSAKCEPIGLTVRAATFEVRRHLRIEPDAPGVVVSRIEPGSKASSAGMKPYDLVTHINDKPVSSPEAFKTLASAPGELTFTIRRLTKGRIIKIAGAAAPASAPKAADAEPADKETPAAKS